MFPAGILNSRALGCGAGGDPNPDSIGGWELTGTRPKGAPLETHKKGG